MACGARQTPGGFAYRVLNRAVARLPLFEKPADHDAFLHVLREAPAQVAPARPGVRPDAQPLALHALARPLSHLRQTTWVEHVHAAQTEAELQRGSPFGTAGWQERTAAQLGLAHAGAAGPSEAGVGC